MKVLYNGDFIEKKMHMLILRTEAINLVTESMRSSEYTMVLCLR